MEEEIGKLEGVPVVEKTIEEYAGQSMEEGETAHTMDFIGVTVQFLDAVDSGDHLIFDSATQFKVDNPVPVYNNTAQRAAEIGYASLFIENGVMKADIFLDYHTPERLMVDNGDKLYPSIMGVVIPGILAEGMETEPIVIKECELTGLALTVKPNVDRRIEPLSPPK